VVHAGPSVPPECWKDTTSSPLEFSLIWLSNNC
jgi:hypothetical protein